MRYLATIFTFLSLHLFSQQINAQEENQDMGKFEVGKDVKCLVKTPEGEDLTINSEVLDIDGDRVLLNSPGQLKVLGDKILVLKKACTHFGIELVDGEYLEVVRKFKKTKAASTDLTKEEQLQVASAMQGDESREIDKEIDKEESQEEQVEVKTEIKKEEDSNTMRYIMYALALFAPLIMIIGVVLGNKNKKRKKNKK